MPRRVIEVGSDNKHLSSSRAFLNISQRGEKLASIPISDVLALVVSGHGITYSNELVVRLSENNIWMVICGKNYQPSAWLWPMAAHSVEAQRIDLQMSLAPNHKQALWTELVKKKIEGQIAVLKSERESTVRLERVRRNVEPGDASNQEAVAAQVYWKSLFGDAFRRNREQPGINAALNYGYTLLRSCVSRALTGSGLHPNIPLHHKNKYSGFRLSDDLVEVFRPIIDWHVKTLWYNGHFTELSSQHKLALAGAMEHKVTISDQEKSLFDAACIVSLSLLEVYRTKSPAKLILPMSLNIKSCGSKDG